MHAFQYRIGSAKLLPMSLKTSFYSASDRIARQLPSALTRLLSMPVNYQLHASEPFIYESARMLYTAFTFCMNNKICGDYAEFGCLEGRTAVEAFRAAKRTANNCRFHIFDSFQGLPETNGIFHTGQFACSRAKVEANLKSYDVDLERSRRIYD